MFLIYVIVYILYMYSGDRGYSMGLFDTDTVFILVLKSLFMVSLASLSRETYIFTEQLRVKGLKWQPDGPGNRTCNLSIGGPAP